MYDIHWKKQAINDLVKIGKGIAQAISMQAAENTVDMIEEKVEKLETFPSLGRPGRKRGTKEMIASKEFFVVYRVLAGDDDAGSVEILRVKHTSQQYP
ncbi:type II toxin-antitoxin system RelE/ParE family toxin [Herbaspirillum huttiense]|uniref:type II toxin-antitoxin system RelE/ParE family toxin n=1 Tax=Herbaspirillum huttiense TaxID=863372 RepID=UPI0038163B18